MKTNILVLVSLLLSLGVVCSSAIEPNTFHKRHEKGIGLYAYPENEHGSKRSHSEVKRMLLEERGETPFVRFKLNTQHSEVKEALLQHYRIEEDINGHFVMGNLFVLSNPQKHFSFQEPLGGCGGNRQKTSVTAAAKQCLVATNAGFFNTHTNDCLGNLVVDGKVVQNIGQQNVNFGITKDGQYIIGYIDKAMIENANGQTQFDQLVQGVVWVVREGRNYVDSSLMVENMTVQETGGSFATIKSARNSIGHDRDGNLMILSIDGKSWQRGVDLYEMANLLVSLGAVNAINLDGGGSVNVAQMGPPDKPAVIVNYPSDECEGYFRYHQMKCERAITSITCVHDSYA